MARSGQVRSRQVRSGQILLTVTVVVVVSGGIAVVALGLHMVDGGAVVSHHGYDGH